MWFTTKRRTSDIIVGRTGFEPILFTAYELTLPVLALPGVSFQIQPNG